jgi:integrase
LVNGEKQQNGGSAVARKRDFTDAYVRSLQPEEHTFRVYDTRVPGLYLRVWPSGKKSFYADCRCSGRRRPYFIGRYPTFYVAEARIEARDALNKAAKGIDPTADKKAHRGATFKEVHKRYVDEYAARRNKSWERTKGLVEKYILPDLGRRAVKDVTRAEIRGAVGGIKPILANQVLAAASAVFSWAIKQDLVTVNPCKGIDRNPTHSRSRIVSDSEVPLLFNALDDSNVAHCVLKMIWLTGQRPGEVGSMRYEHIRDDWELPGQKTQVWVGTKNGRDHKVPLSRTARAIIDGQRQGNITPITGYVFSGVGGRPVDNLHATMRSICERLGIRDRIKPHDLRRSALSAITRLGFSRHVMDLIANHRTDTVTDVYDRHSYTDEIKRAMETVADHITNLALGGGAGAVASKKF